ncbi:MAG: molecular chaperone Tir [Bacteroidales bacterium]|nr:molecular chaperone Tir [Bacteroidales bacterium]
MSIQDRVYRTCTYIAGDWTGDSAAVDKLMEWNEGNKWGLHYTDVHKLTQSYDGSLNCNIKSSLRTRMSISKKFVLVVGSCTDSLRSGACHKCTWYKKPNIYQFVGSCALGHSYIDNRSYVQYECDLAKKGYENDEIDIVVLYNSVNINRSLCPEKLRYVGTHAPMKKKTTDMWGYSHIEWDYASVKKAIG